MERNGIQNNTEYYKHYAINFDLSLEMLKKHYSLRNPKAAYKELKKFFKKEGFVHRQYSGYLSKEKITSGEIFYIIMRMNAAFPWLAWCSKRIDVTVVDQYFDAKEIIAKLNDNHEINYTDRQSVIQQLNEINAAMSSLINTENDNNNYNDFDLGR